MGCCRPSCSLDAASQLILHSCPRPSCAHPQRYCTPVALSSLPVLETCGGWSRYALSLGSFGGRCAAAGGASLAEEEAAGRWHPLCRSRTPLPAPLLPICSLQLLLLQRLRWGGRLGPDDCGVQELHRLHTDAVPGQPPTAARRRGRQRRRRRNRALPTHAQVKAAFWQQKQHQHTHNA